MGHGGLSTGTFSLPSRCRGQVPTGHGQPSHATTPGGAADRLTTCSDRQRLPRPSHQKPKQSMATQGQCPPHWPVLIGPGPPILACPLLWTWVISISVESSTEQHHTRPSLRRPQSSPVHAQVRCFLKTKRIHFHNLLKQKACLTLTK